jgi:hypothetical protein
MAPHVRFAERNKRPGVYYAVTDDGLELPILDVTHPAFAPELATDADAERTRRFLDEQRRFARLPPWLRRLMLRFFLRGSRIARGVRRADGTFLDAMTTYLFKLGPKNLGAYAVPADRRILRSLPAVSVRLRVHDMARLTSDALAPRLAEAPSAPLWLVNVAGGPAIDSLNTLRLLQARASQSLRGRRICIVVLDADEHGAAFGARALAAWQEPTTGATSRRSTRRSAKRGRRARSSQCRRREACSSTERTKRSSRICAASRLRRSRTASSPAR